MAIMPVVNNTPRLVALLSVFRSVLCQLLLVSPELIELSKGFYEGLVITWLLSRQYTAKQNAECSVHMTRAVGL